MSAEVVEKLREARALIEDPEHWTQGWYAKDSRGEYVPTGADEACRWCAVGALWRVLGVGGALDSGNHPDGDADAILNRAAADMGADAVPDLNDGFDGLFGTHADVLALYDRAIELAEASR